MSEQYLKSGFPRGLRLRAGEVVEITENFSIYIDDDGSIRRGIRYDGHGGAVPVYPYKASTYGSGWDLYYGLTIKNVKRIWDKISWF